MKTSKHFSLKCIIIMVAFKYRYIFKKFGCMPLYQHTEYGVLYVGVQLEAQPLDRFEFKPSSPPSSPPSQLWLVHCMQISANKTAAFLPSMKTILRKNKMNKRVKLTTAYMYGYSFHNYVHAHAAINFIILPRIVYACLLFLHSC